MKTRILILLQIILNLFVLIVIIVDKSNITINEPFEKVQLIDSTDYYSCIAHIKQYEGFESEAYQLGDNYYVGYGFLCYEGMTIDIIQANSKVKKIFNNKIEFAKRVYDVEDNQAFAIALLVYRWGRGNLLSSKLHKELLTKNPIGIYREWSEINKFQSKFHNKINERMEFEINMFFKY